MKVVLGEEYNNKFQLERDDAEDFPYASYSPSYKTICLDGDFDLEELRAIIEFMEAQP